MARRLFNVPRPGRMGRTSSYTIPKNPYASMGGRWAPGPGSRPFPSARRTARPTAAPTSKASYASSPKASVKNSMRTSQRPRDLPSGPNWTHLGGIAQEILKNQLKDYLKLPKGSANGSMTTKTATDGVVKRTYFKSARTSRKTPPSAYSQNYIVKTQFANNLTCTAGLQSLNVFQTGTTPASLGNYHLQLTSVLTNSSRYCLKSITGTFRLVNTNNITVYCTLRQVSAKSDLIISTGTASRVISPEAAWDNGSIYSTAAVAGLSTKPGARPSESPLYNQYWNTDHTYTFALRPGETMEHHYVYDFNMKVDYFHWEIANNAIRGVTRYLMLSTLGGVVHDATNDSNVSYAGHTFDFIHDIKANFSSYSSSGTKYVDSVVVESVPTPQFVVDETDTEAAVASY